jgi:hypothetical protein
MQKHKTIYDIHIVVIDICCNFFNNKYMHLYRGQSGNSGSIAFRVWYNKIQELRSLLPSNTPFVALTATAMKSTREKICNALNMRSPEFIMVSPERINISYAVVKMSNQVNVIGTLTGYFVCLNPTVSR